MQGVSATGPFRQRVVSGERMFGTFLKTPTSHAAEILAQEGYAFVVVDEEHAPFNPETTDRILAACRATGIAGVVRVADTGQILRVLDCGAARYRGGARGFSNTTRAGGFGATGMAEHIAEQDAGVAVVAMIEDPRAIDCIDAIAAVDGIDAFFIGRGDLTVAYGAQSQAASEVRGAVDAITAAARKAGRRVFVMSGTPEDAAELSAKGATGFIMASDQGFMRQGAKAVFQSYAAALSEKQSV